MNDFMKANICTYCDCFKECQGKYLGPLGMNKNIAFNGCEALDQELIKERLVNYYSLTAFDGDMYREINLSDRLKFESIWEIIIAAQGSNKWNLAALSNIFHISKISVRADIKSKLLAKLMELSRYQNNPHLLFCALLIRLELNDPFLIIKLFPGYDLGEYYRNQSRIYADIEESLPDKIKVIKVALKMLTPKQMQAVMAYYIDNDEKCSMDIISKRLKISKSALKERLDTAKRSMGIGFENYFKVMKIIDDLKR